MSPSEIAFLALGLVLGTALGAAIAQGVARRPAPRREVRLTITPNAIPGRQSPTRATPNGVAVGGVVPGSPAALALDDGPDAPARDEPVVALPAVAAAAPPPPQVRTRVPSGPTGIPDTAVAVPVVAEPPARTGPGLPAPAPAAAPVPSSPSKPPRASGAVAVLEAPPVVRAAAAGAPIVGIVLAPTEPATTDRDPAGGDLAPVRLDSFTTLVRPRRPAVAARPALAATAVAVLRPVASATPPSGASGATPGAAVPGGLTDPCAGPRRLVDERCALAEAAREQARSAADALREAQRVYDVLRERVDHAQIAADPRHVAAAKEQLHAEFRSRSDRAGGPDETEQAAREWLQEINELNNVVREAQRVLEAGNAELRAQLPVLDRLAAEADAARITGENAEGGCREAREQLAACDEEAATRARDAVPPVADDPDPFPGVWPADRPDLPEPAGAPDLLEGLPVIVRVLRGDREARQRLVASLGASDPDGEREWGLRISRLVDAINARAIEDGYLNLPKDDAFWRLFEDREVRDIVGALSALGHRYDGMGGFADGRVPAPRDLSLAVGYAGLDRMRIRTWPHDADISLLYERAVVAADEWLADQAGDLSLGTMVDALGNRAAELADVWNAWGRVRPALLAS